MFDLTIVLILHIFLFLMKGTHEYEWTTQLLLMQLSKVIQFNGLKFCEQYLSELIRLEYFKVRHN